MKCTEKALALANTIVILALTLSCGGSDGNNNKPADRSIAELRERIADLEERVSSGEGVNDLLRQVEKIGEDQRQMSESISNPISEEIEETFSRAVGLISVGAAATFYDRQSGESISRDFRVSEGTGFIFSRDGHILTNHHVVELALDQSDLSYIANAVIGDPRIHVSRLRFGLIFFINGRSLYADILECSERLDYCLLRLRDEQPYNTDWEPLPIHPNLINLDGQLRRGDRILALGYPAASRVGISDAQIIEEVVREVLGTKASDLYKQEDYLFTVTTGIVSRIASDFEGTDFIHHDALISSGSSGGPLVTQSGHVIGINTYEVDQRYGVAVGLYSVLMDLQHRGYQLQVGD